MLFVLMYFMYIMYMLCFCILCLYAIYEWPEFYVNKDIFCSVNKDFSSSNSAWIELPGILWYFTLHGI